MTKLNKNSWMKIPIDEKVEIECPHHGTFFTTPRNHLKKWGCPCCKEDKDNGRNYHTFSNSFLRSLPKYLD